MFDYARFTFFLGMIQHVDHTKQFLCEVKKTNCRAVCTMLSQVCVYVYIWMESIWICAPWQNVVLMEGSHVCAVHMVP